MLMELHLFLKITGGAIVCNIKTQRYIDAGIQTGDF